ncbi:N-acetylneuraminate synthase [Oceanirhabdus seepicola]|uniref:N-acetylneuraminate synthase n=1 Tax=Oceanirhabdus seepicola TaxID=2828781 RepID=A0A9J6P9U5_9CLOT|nr:N-acetylneuraminate synthase [Oceanirhabdus seepicola]MCM1992638.1 N-acetylneuraminate synthase [Oceanirhabdus seepicola]
MRRDNVYIIAEAGVNHNGDMELAKKLVEKAKWAGANAVKFQLFKSENMTSSSAVKADYQRKTTGEMESQLQMLKKLEIGFTEHKILKNYCEEVGIDFLTSPFDIESIKELSDLGIELIKIPSGEITNLPYLRAVAETNKKVILSTGMSDMGEVKRAVEVLENSCEEIIVLHCNTEYPTPMEDVNLSAMLTLKEELNKEVGYSDHTLGIEVPIAAVSLGARVIEKHFTLDKSMIGPDHKASLEPTELKNMIQCIRNIEMAMGNGLKVTSKSELKNKGIARKSIVAAENIEAGEIFTEKNITCKRPGNGISPMEWDKVIGTKAKRNFKSDELIEFYRRGY